ncbi:MAG TPA: rod shape-determining protein MreD [Candidatus Coprocola pullicola]|nr:rod shape-determining protein MreD [Candidatus Coprocola pullicola]
MRVLITALFIIINFFIQSTILHYIEIRGVIPNTTIILVVSYALLRGSVEGAIVGFFTGILQDIFFGVSIGYFALLNTITGYLFGRGNHNFYRENYILPMMLCAIAVFSYETIIYITGFLFRGQLNFLYILGNTLLPETVYSCIFTIPLYRILFGTNEWLELKEKYKYRLF